MIYLDHSATTPLDPEVFAEMLPFLKEEFGNPSSLYSLGRKAKLALAEAREKIAFLFNASKEEIIFTSSGTEANNLALTGICRSDPRKKIITSSIEHPSVLKSCRFLEKKGYQIIYLPVDSYGLVDLESLEQALSDDVLLVSIMHANNEIGTIQPIKKIAEIIQKKSLNKKVYFHVDAVQTAGKIPIDLSEIPIDLLSLSSHKIYGPKGAGALYVRKKTPLTPLLHGGGQEYKRRSSTENVAAIVGFAKACEMMQKNPISKKDLRDDLYAGIQSKIPHIIRNGHPEKCLDHLLNISFLYIEGESLLLHLDMKNVCVSTGSACSSSSLEPSYVLLALGKSHEEAHGSIRFSLGKNSTKEEIDKVLTVLPPIVQKLRNISPLYLG